MKNFYSHYDFLPTIVDLLGLKLTKQEQEKMAKLPGRSLVPVLVKEETEDEKTVIIYSEYGPVRKLLI